jgi:hypothetical protein
LWEWDGPLTVSIGGGDEAGYPCIFVFLANVSLDRARLSNLVKSGVSNILEEFRAWKWSNGSSLPDTFAPSGTCKLPSPLELRYGRLEI